MKTLKAIILPLSFFCLLISIGFFAFFFADHYQDETDKEELINKKANMTEAAISTVEPDIKKILLQYEILYNENPDLIGWIKIEDTPIDYPVMQNKEDGEYYLHRNFKKEYEYSGLPFLDKRCNYLLPSTNLIIYGHNMKSETMFSRLKDYEKKEFYLEHPIIQFDTIYEEAEYEIVAVIQSKVFKKTEDTFKFYQFIQADTNEEFDTFIQNMKKISLYETGVEASYGDQLLTLVTCSYHTENGRLAVLAKKMN